MSFDIAPASAITFAVKCLEPKLPPVYIGWKSISSGAICSVPEITQAAKLSMFEFECTSIRPVARVEVADGAGGLHRRRAHARPAQRAA